MSNQLAFFLGAMFATVLLAIFQSGSHDERRNCTSGHVRNLSPHEQEEEPRLASARKIPEDERFIF